MKQINERVKIQGHYIEVNEEFNIGILELMKKENTIFMPPRAELIKVTYTDLERLLKPTVFKSFPDNHFSIETQNLGVFKRTEWQDQQEWRYRLNSIPLNVNEFAEFVNHQNIEILLNRLRSRKELPFIDLPLKDDIFEDMEILCGPQMQEESKKDLIEMLKVHAPNTIVRHSKIKIRI